MSTFLKKNKMWVPTRNAVAYNKKIGKGPYLYILLFMTTRNP